jgi:hypothetical protein
VRVLAREHAHAARVAPLGHHDRVAHLELDHLRDLRRGGGGGGGRKNASATAHRSSPDG